MPYAAAAARGSRTVQTTPVSLAPNAVANLALWLRADTGVFEDDAMTTAATADGDVIGGWQDQSGNGRHVIQATATKQPKLKLDANGINGLPVIRFDGSDILVNGSAFLTGQTGAVLGVVRISDPAKYGALLCSADAASTSYFVVVYGHYLKNFSVHQRNADTLDWLRGVTDYPDAGLPVVLLAYSDGTATRMVIDNNTEVAVQGGGSNNGDWFGDTNNRDNVTVGGRRLSSDSDFLVGDLAELVVYDPLPSVAEVRCVVRYLADKYAIPIYEHPQLTSGLGVVEAIGLYDTDNPVIAIGSSGTSDYRIRENGNVLYEPADTGAKYKTWYTGYSDATNHKVHYAYSTDGKSWTKYASNPVIGARQAEDPYVVKSGSTYYLFAEDIEAGAPWRVRRWSSSNLTDWTDDGQVTGLDAQQPASPTVWIEGATWYMLYEALASAPYPTRLATSADGMAWTDDASNPVWTTADITDANVDASVDAVPDDVRLIGSTYYMTYHYHVTGGQARSGLAASTDKVNWSDLRSPLLIRGQAAAVSTVMFGPSGTAWCLGYTLDTSGLYRGFLVAQTN